MPDGSICVLNRRSATWYSMRLELFRTGGMAGKMRS
jgi:hypothetical protein